MSRGSDVVLLDKLSNINKAKEEGRIKLAL